MKTIAEKLEDAFEVKFDDKTRARLDRYEEAAIERGELKTDIFEMFLNCVDEAIDKDINKANRS